MKRLAIVLPCAALLLASCASERHYSIEMPPPSMPPASAPANRTATPPRMTGNAGPLAQAGIGKYMDGLERDLRKNLHGTLVARRGDVIVLTFGTDVLFGKGVDLNGDGRDRLDTLGDVLRHYDRTLIQIGGHTDTSGSPERNLKVSQRRAEAVAAAFRGVDARRIQATGFGETQLKIATGDNKAEPRNRRVEIRIIPHPG